MCCPEFGQLCLFVVHYDVQKIVTCHILRMQLIVIRALCFGRLFLKQGIFFACLNYGLPGLE